MSADVLKLEEKETGGGGGSLFATVCANWCYPEAVCDNGGFQLSPRWAILNLLEIVRARGGVGLQTAEVFS